MRRIAQALTSIAVAGTFFLTAVPAANATIVGYKSPLKGKFNSHGLVGTISITPISALNGRSYDSLGRAIYPLVVFAEKINVTHGVPGKKYWVYIKGGTSTRGCRAIADSYSEYKKCLLPKNTASFKVKADGTYTSQNKFTLATYETPGPTSAGFYVLDKHNKKTITASAPFKDNFPISAHSSLITTNGTNIGTFTITNTKRGTFVPKIDIHDVPPNIDFNVTVHGYSPYTGQSSTRVLYLTSDSSGKKSKTFATLKMSPYNPEIIDSIDITYYSPSGIEVAIVARTPLDIDLTTIR